MQNAVEVTPIGSVVTTATVGHSSFQQFTTELLTTLIFSHWRLIALQFLLLIA